MVLMLGMPVISNYTYRNNTIKMGHHQKQTINNCCSVLIPLLFSNSRVDKANSKGYNHRLITRLAELGVETIDHGRMILPLF